MRMVHRRTDVGLAWVDRSSLRLCRRARCGVYPAPFYMTPSNTTWCPTCTSTSAQISVIRRTLADLIGRLDKMTAPAAAPSAAPTSRPSPPTSRCACRPHTDGSGRPRAHVRACPDYMIEDEAWVLTHWTDARTGKAPSYAEALAAVRQAAELRHRYAVPSKYITVTLPARTTDELLRDLGESLRDALHAQSELKARHIAGQRCGACPPCRGHTASTLCERELVAPREALRGLWCHVQALGHGDGLSTEAQAVLGSLRRAMEVLAQSAGVK